MLIATALRHAEDEGPDQGAQGVPIAEEADGEGDPASAADDVRSEHAEVADRVECPGYAAHRAGHEDHREPDPLDALPRHIDRLGILARRSYGEPERCAVQDEPGDRHDRVDDVGEDVLREENGAEDRDTREQGIGRAFSGSTVRGTIGTPKNTRMEKAQRPDTRILIAVPVTTWCCFK